MNMQHTQTFPKAARRTAAGRRIRAWLDPVLGPYSGGYHLRFRRHAGHDRGEEGADGDPGENEPAAAVSRAACEG